MSNKSVSFIVQWSSMLDLVHNFQLKSLCSVNIEYGISLYLFVPSIICHKAEELCSWQVFLFRLGSRKLNGLVMVESFIGFST